MNRSEKVLSVLSGLCLAAMLVPTAAFAAETDGQTKTITSSEELISAIQNQQAGETWVLKALDEGEAYDVSDACLDVVANINNVEKGFVFPIFVDDLTIQGEDGVVITSSYNLNSGNWNSQNFITIGSSGVTIENVDIKGNPNGYYGNMCNKALELIGEGQNLTLQNVDVLPTANEDGTQWSGSVFINVADAGETVIDNVTLSAWISARSVTTGTVQVENTVMDFTKNAYAGYADYGFGVSGDKASLENVTIKVDGSVDLVNQVTNNLKPGTTVELTEDIEVDEMVYIQTDNVTIKGNGNEITASPDFKAGTHGQVQLLKVQEAENVVLEDLSLVATAANKHVLDVWQATNLTLKNVTLDHTNAADGAPLINTSSSITVEGTLSLATGDNSWYGMNIDNEKYGGEASITFADESELSFTNNAEEEKGIVYMELADDTDPADVIVNPENAGLLLDGESGQFVPHTHAYGDWQSDETNHWKECSCGDIAEQGAHEFEWVIDQEATADKAGSKHEECSVCGYKKAAVEIPATGTGDTTAPAPDGSDDPDTGDSTPWLWMLLAVISGGAVVTLTLLAGNKSKARH